MGKEGIVNTLEIYPFLGHWPARPQGRKTRKTVRERIECKSSEKVTLKQRRGCGLEGPTSQEGRTEHRVKKRLEKRDRKKAKKEMKMRKELEKKEEQRGRLGKQ